MSKTGKTERFELQMNAQGKGDIIDWVESKEKNAICIYNDLGVLPFSSAKAVCDKLNEQDERIKELEREKKSYMDDAIKFEKECKRLYNNLRLTNADLYDEQLMHDKCKKENEQLKQELFEIEKDYLIETYSDNSTRRDEKIQGLKEEFKERFGDFE